VEPPRNKATAPYIENSPRRPDPIIKERSGILSSVNASRSSVLLLLFLLTFGLYLPYLTAPFQYDDQSVIVGNDLIREVRNLPEFFAKPRIDSRDQFSGAWRPITMATLTLNYSISGNHPWSYRAANAIFHAGAVLMLYLLLHSLTSSPLPSLLGAILFAVHPLHVHSILHVWKRSGILASLFIFGGLWAFIRLSGRRQIVLVLLCFLLALLSKEDAAIFPLLLSAIWIGWPAVRTPEGKRTLLASMIVAVVYSLFFYFWIRTRGTFPSSFEHAIEQLTMLTNISVQLVATWNTFWLMIVPIHLNVDHWISPATLTLLDYVGAFFGLLFLMTAIAAASLRDRRAFLVGALLLVPFAPFLMIPLMIRMDEARTYIPLAGLALAIAMGHSSRVKTALLFGIITLFIARTEFRANLWRNSVQLWADSVRQQPNNTRALNALTYALLDEGRKTEALKYGQISTQISPQSPTSWLALARAQDAMKNSEAYKSYRKVLELNPQSADAWNNLGAWLADHGKMNDAKEAFEMAITIDPNFSTANKNLLQLTRSP